ncbi:hypothetical protein NDU88_000827 [Pleurodeles waltl]|uniref:Uncharacterized protein n=1 Tax=Pleurodeles waltl TaxID=8319 RepID=A0AAV7SAM4_PLEWA|nr:hypothetical protein NDU88_000827 [Pleurodeles waltl]
MEGAPKRTQENVAEQGNLLKLSNWQKYPRAATPSEEDEAQETKEYIRYVVDRTRPLPISLNHTHRATASDECVQQALEAVRRNQWHRFKTRWTQKTPEARCIMDSLYPVCQELVADPD